MTDVLSILTICLYLSGTLLFISGAVFHKKNLNRFAETATLAGFTLHGAELVYLYFSTATPAPGYGDFYLSLLSWSLLFIFFILKGWLKIEFLALAASPLALLLFLSSFTLQNVKIALPAGFGKLWFGFHIGAMFLSIGLLAAAFGAGVLFIFIEKVIKTKGKLPPFLKTPPSLDSLDTANDITVKIGFPLYTIGLLTGFIWAFLTWKKMFSWDPKETASILIWLLYAYLFHQRVVQGLRGRKPAKTALWVFTFTLISLIGINFFLPTHHSLKP